MNEVMRFFDNSRAGFADNCANTNRVITGKGALPPVEKQRNCLPARNRPGLVLLFPGALLLVLASALFGCRTSPVIGGYRSAIIDPATLKIELSDPIVQRFDEKDRALPVLGSYYTYFTNEWGDLSYDHYHQDTNDQQRVRYSHLEGGSDHIIHKASKQQELLRGVFGTVYAEKTCYFQLPTANYHNHFWVTAYANDTEHEVPIVLDNKPSGSQTLTQMSLIRVFRRPPRLCSGLCRLFSTGQDPTPLGEWVKRRRLGPSDTIRPVRRRVSCLFWRREAA